MKTLLKHKLGFVFLFLQLVFSVALCTIVFYVEFIPTRYSIAVVVVCVALLAYQFLSQMANSSYVIGRVLCIFFCAFFSLGGYYLYDTYYAMAEISDADTKVDVISFYVLADESAQSLPDAKDYTFGILSTIDRENTNKAIAEAETTTGQKIKTIEYQDSSMMVDALYAKEIQVAVFNQGFLNTIKEQYKTFDTDTRELLKHEIETKVESVEEEDDYSTKVTTEPFIVYLSGIDVYGDLSQNSRSDVNVLAIVNPLTKKLLLVSTPRDYFVPLYNTKGESVSNGMSDKLTHAGIYGVETSMGTLEHLYNVDIDYYVRVNFTSVKKIVDLLGGVKVYSDFDFYSDWGPQGAGTHYHFNKGYNKVNGKKALAFCRERHHFENGDFQRGRDHQHMIEAILNKIMSPAMLGNYPKLLKEGKQFFQTSMSVKKIVSLCRMQLDDMAQWKITYANAAGGTSTGYSYSMPSTRLYVCSPDMDSVEKITKRINKFMKQTAEDVEAKDDSEEASSDGSGNREATTDEGTRPLNDMGY